MAPIIKNRQYNFPPIGANLIVGAQARPNEITYSEDWLRPDYIPPSPQNMAAAAPAESAPPAGAPLAAEAPAPPPDAAIPTDPSAGLPGLMLPLGGQP